MQRQIRDFLPEALSNWIDADTAGYQISDYRQVGDDTIVLETTDEFESTNYIVVTVRDATELGATLDQIVEALRLERVGR